MSDRIGLMTDLMKLKLILEGEIIRVNALEMSTDVDSPDQMTRLNTYRRALADRYVQYGAQLARLCDSYDREGALRAARN